MSAFRVLSPGMLTTVQDRGRWGLQNLGVAVAGAMDVPSLRLANRLVGNPDETAALEVTLIGPTLEFEGETVFAVAGAVFELFLDGAAVADHTVHRAGSGQQLRFGTRRSGARAYLACCGGIDVPPVFGSRSTHLPSRMGGHHGRALVRDDVLEVGPAATRPVVGRTTGVRFRPPPRGRIRFIRGPNEALFSESAYAALTGARYLIAPESNRMGYRLDGPPVPYGDPAAAAGFISDATPAGSLQVPPDGKPILLMADRQTSGGYPKAGVVITADLGAAGRVAPGEEIRFHECSHSEARDALLEQERWLEQI